MKVGDIVYAKHPRMAGMSYLPGIIVKQEKMYKVGYRYYVLFPDVGLKWIYHSGNLIPFEDMWEDEEVCELAD